MTYLQNDESETDSNRGASGLRGHNDTDTQGRAPTYAPVFQKWLSNYRTQLDKVRRGERGEAISEQVPRPREEDSE
jgi:hypothetical protein